MTRYEIEKMREAIAELKDALQVSTLTIEQVDGRWPKYDASWKAETINVVEGHVEPRLPSYMNKLGNNCKYRVVLSTFARYTGPRYSDNGIAYGNPADLFQARWGRTRAGELTAPPSVPRTPSPRAQMERKAALITGRQVPLDPERLDKLS